MTQLLHSHPHPCRCCCCRLLICPHIQLLSSVHAIYEACTVTWVYIWDDGDSISGIPPLGPYADPEIEMSPHTATRQLLLLCVLIDAHQKKKEGTPAHTRASDDCTPHANIYIPHPTTNITPPPFHTQFAVVYIHIHIFCTTSQFPPSRPSESMYLRIQMHLCMYMRIYTHVYTPANGRPVQEVSLGLGAGK